MLPVQARPQESKSLYMTDSSVPTLQHQVETLGPKSGERAITGTGADLRKLSMEDSKRQLMSMGMSEEEVARALFVSTFLLWQRWCCLWLSVTQCAVLLHFLSLATLVLPSALSHALPYW